MESTMSGRDLLKGPSAYVLFVIRLWSMAPPCSMLLFALALMGAGVPQSWLTTTVLFVGAVSGIPYPIYLNWAPVKERKEVRAGYTTFPRSHIEVEQRDPYLGRVIRQAGEEYLDWSSFREICRQAKEEAKALRSAR